MRHALGATLVLVTAGLLVAAVAALATAEDAPPPPPAPKAADDRGPRGDWPPVAARAPMPARPPLTEAGQLAFDVLLQTERFTGESIGADGITPAEVESLRVLHREPQARKAFLTLCQRATPAGRLWGLCGLWYWDKARFHRQVAALLRDHGDTKVRLVQGETTGERAIRSIVQDQAPGVIRLESRSQTCRAWTEAHAPLGGARYDILGGGWPCLHRSGG